MSSCRADDIRSVVNVSSAGLFFRHVRHIVPSGDAVDMIAMTIMPYE